MFETGLAIFLGLVFIFIKLKRRTMQNVIDVLKGRECKNIVVPRKK